MKKLLADEAATEAAGAELFAQLMSRLHGNAVVFLQGDLGAGKTTLVRGLLRAAGYSGSVKSPTYTLLEPYALPGLDIYHFDLYRVNDPQELEFVGIDEIVESPGLKLFEWPERAQNWLPQPAVTVALRVVTNAKGEPPGREVDIEFA